MNIRQRRKYNFFLNSTIFLHLSMTVLDEKNQLKNKYFGLDFYEKEV